MSLTRLSGVFNTAFMTHDFTKRSEHWLVAEHSQKFLVGRHCALTRQRQTLSSSPVGAVAVRGCLSAEATGSQMLKRLPAPASL